MVEKILDSQLLRNQLQFLVKWEGYGYEENSWVSEKDISAPDKSKNSMTSTLEHHGEFTWQPSNC